MKTVGIIGGGICGLFSAYYLSGEGHDVTILDSGSFEDGCSYGNAGMIVPSHIIPLAQPGMIAKGMRWMLSSESPFYVKPRLSWELMKWGFQFWKHSTEKHVRDSIPHLRDISLLSKELYQELSAKQDINFGWQEKGLLMLFKAQNSRQESEEEAHTAVRAGIEAHVLSGKEVQSLEPDVKVDVAGGVYYPGDAHIYPNQLLANLVTYLKSRGVRFRGNHHVNDIEVQNGTVTRVLTNAGSYSFNEIVLSSGAWSQLLVHKLGISLPLQGGKGYSFMTGQVNATIKIPAIMLEARATATPMGSGIRFAGTLEVAGTDQSINMNRVRGIHSAINRYYPDLQVKFPNKEEVWSGLRPCSPDGLPYIGRLKQISNVTIATGHGMMGVSLGPATGKLVTDLISGHTTSMAVSVFDPGRFN